MFTRLVSYLLVLIFCCAIVTSEEGSSTASTYNNYDTKFDDIDIDEILTNERLLQNYLNCLKSEGPCTPDGRMLRDTIPDAVTTGCSKCSEKQRVGSEKVIHFLIENKPQDWEFLERIYDPQGSYRKAYLEQKANTVKSED